MATRITTRSPSGSSLLQRELLHSESYGKLHRSYCQLKGVKLLLRADLDAAAEIDAVEQNNAEDTEIPRQRVVHSLPTASTVCDEMEALRAEVVVMRTQINCKHLENQRFLEHVEQTCKKLSDLRSDLDAARDSQKESEQHLAEEACQVCYLRTEVEDVLRERERHRKSEEQAVSVATDLRADLRHARLELDDRNSLLVGVSAELHSLRSRVAHRSAEETAHVLQRAELLAFREEAETAASEMATTHKTLEQLRVQCENSDADAEDSAALAAVLLSEAWQAAAQRDQCAVHADRAASEVLMLRDELSRAHWECGEQVRFMTHAQSEFLDLQSEVGYMRSQALSEAAASGPEEREDALTEELAAKLREFCSKNLLLESELQRAHAMSSSSETLAEQESHKVGTLRTELLQEKAERDSCSAFAESAHSEIASALPVMKRTEAEYREARGLAEEATEEVASLCLQAESLVSEEELKADREEAASRIEALREEVAQISADRDCLSWHVSQDAHKFAELCLELSLSKQEQRESMEHAARAEACDAELSAVVDLLRNEQSAFAAELTSLREAAAGYKDLTTAAGQAATTIGSLHAEMEALNSEGEAETHHAQVLSNELSMISAKSHSCSGESCSHRKGDCPLLTAASPSPPCVDSLSFSLTSSDGLCLPGADETHVDACYDQLVSEIVLLNQELRSALSERDAQHVNAECSMAEVSALKCQIDNIGTEKSVNARRAKRASSETRRMQHEAAQARCEAQCLHSELLLSIDNVNAMKTQSAQLRAELAAARADLAGEAAALTMAKLEGSAERRNDSAIFRGELVIAVEAERRASEAQATARSAELVAEDARASLSNNQEQVDALKEELATSRARTARLCEQTSSVVLGVVQRFAGSADAVQVQEPRRSHATPSFTFALDSEQAP